MANRFEDRVVLITGGASGIGAAAARRFAAEGARLMLGDCNEEGLGRITAELEGSGAKVGTRVVDVADRAQVESLNEAAVERFGRLDVLFNNAGIGAPPVPLEELPYETWQNVVATNLTGIFLCTQEAIKIMKDQKPRGGRIINNGSISAHAPRPNSTPYSATKHAVTGLTKCASLDGRKYDIACGQIDIGNARTEMAARMAKGVPQANGEIAIEAVMDVQHVAKAIVFMAGLSLDSNVQFMTLMATKAPFVGRG